MTSAEELDGISRRFDVELFIIHPSMDPDAITASLGLEGHYVRRAGDARVTPKGKPLAGQYPDTRWRHCREHSAENQWCRDTHRLR